MVLNRGTGEIKHRIFSDIGEYLRNGDVLVVNETKVLAGRLYARKVPTGGKVEILLLSQRMDNLWEVLVGGKGVKAGKILNILSKSGATTDLFAEVQSELDGGRRLVRFDQPVETALSEVGHVPLPPYIHSSIIDPHRYQTVYARYLGSAAAPTAGLHFTPRLIRQLKNQSIRFASVTLHVGLDTFAPVNEESPTEHRIHSEWCQVTAQNADIINQARRSGRRIVAVGTTSVRTVETAAQSGDLKPFEGATDLFILPGYKFKAVDAMITNFHLPRSTLIMLVSAFVGRDQILGAYETAMEEGYRFYSFGDAMLIL